MVVQSGEKKHIWKHFDMMKKCVEIFRRDLEEEVEDY